MDLITFLSSSVVGGLLASLVAALVAALVAIRSSERQIQIENVTQERAIWREKIRSKSVEVHRAAVAGNSEKLSELHMEFSLNLNPFHQEDKGILAVIAVLKDRDTVNVKLAEFTDRIALLLKHDWERAKHEAKPRSFITCSPIRTTYAEFRG